MKFCGWQSLYAKKWARRVRSTFDTINFRAFRSFFLNRIVQPSQRAMAGKRRARLRPREPAPPAPVQQPKSVRVSRSSPHQEADAILSWHPDRLARNSIDGGKIIHFLDTGVLKNLYFPTLMFENNPNGKFMLSIAFSQSKYYVDNLSENVKRGIRQKLRRGEWSWYAPLGYVNNPTTRNIEPDPEYARFIASAFELYKTGDYTLLALQRTLEDLGLRTRKGSPPSPSPACKPSSRILSTAE